MGYGIYFDPSWFSNDMGPPQPYSGSDQAIALYDLRNNLPGYYGGVYSDPPEYQWDRANPYGNDPFAPANNDPSIWDTIKGSITIPPYWRGGNTSGGGGGGGTTPNSGTNTTPTTTQNQTGGKFSPTSTSRTQTGQPSNTLGTVLKTLSGIPQWAGGTMTGGGNMGSYSPTSSGGIDWGKILGGVLGGVFGGGGSGGGGDAASAVNNAIYNILPQQQQGGFNMPMVLPYPVGGTGDTADFTPFTSYLNYLNGANNPWINSTMPQMFPQVSQGYGTGSQLGQEGYNQLLLGGNLAERMGQGQGIMTPQQQQLQSQAMSNINTGGLNPETVAAMRRLILEPQQEQMLGNVNKLAGGGALLTSPAYQEMIRRNDQNFMDQTLASAYQNLPQYYNIANQITQQPMQQGMQLGNLYGNLGQVGGGQGLGYYGAAGNLGLGMNNSANNLASVVGTGYGNLYNTQSRISENQNIARAQSQAMMLPWLMSGNQSSYPSWPNWPTTATQVPTTIPGYPTNPKPATTSPTTPYSQIMSRGGR